MALASSLRPTGNLILMYIIGAKYVYDNFDDD